MEPGFVLRGATANSAAPPSKKLAERLATPWYLPSVVTFGLEHQIEPQGEGLPVGGPEPFRELCDEAALDGGVARAVGQRLAVRLDGDGLALAGLDGAAEGERAEPVAQRGLGADAEVEPARERISQRHRLCGNEEREWMGEERVP